ncbi:ABC transporter permease [Cohnella hongkongensis]|uniref:ABC transporter permease n=1 Tax=Cohnella hongkongensis TaxID=178337 RepID=A0ABV9F8H5_9BACL
MKARLFHKIKQYRTLLLMLSPTLIYFFVFSYLPMAGNVMAFKNYQYDLGIFGSKWVGFENFRFFFISGDGLRVTMNTILYNLAFIAVNTVLQVFAAVLLAEIAGRWFKKITQTVMFLPYFISWVVVGAIAYNLFNYEHGTLNNMLTALGWNPIDIYNTPSLWKYLLVIVAAWKVIGYGTVFYLSAIMGIDKELYEAADIDGANVFQQIRRITIPCLKPTIMILILLGIGNVFRGDFGMFYQLANNPILYNATDVIDTYVFRSLISNGDVGMSAAIGFYQSVLCFVTILAANYLVRSANKDYAIF